MSHYQEQGRAAYRRKDYTKALAYFDRAIGLTPSVQLLDNRAACHERLEDLSAALKDAKKAIQIGKADPTGYLRAGRILRKMEKKDVALEIYSYGLKCVKTVGQGYELLRKTHGELMSELSPAKSVDPLTLLPRELAEEVLDYLTFKQLMNTCRVSKQWAQFIRRTPNLWRHLDLGQARKQVKKSFISRSINVGRQKLTAATLNNMLSDDFQKSLTTLVRCCPLEELTLLDTGGQGRDLISILKKANRMQKLRIGSGTHFTDDQILSEIVHNASDTLRSLQCDDLGFAGAQGGLKPMVTFKSMRRLDVSWSRASGDMVDLMSHLHQFPNLQFLKLHQLRPVGPRHSTRFDLSDHADLEHVDLFFDLTDISNLKLPRSISHLALGSFTRDPDYLSRRNPLEWVLPDLASLCISVNSLTFEDVVGVLERTTNATPLHTLHLRECALPSKPERQSLARMVWKHPRLASLKHLGLEEAVGCDDVMVEIIAECLGELKSLNISSTLVTGVGVKAVVEKTNLKRLVANNCNAIGHDAVDWARQQGVQVERRVTDGLSGGKKVRH